MEKFRKLKIGEVIQSNDEIKHRNKWLPSTEFSRLEIRVYENMKPARRKMSINIVNDDYEVFDGNSFIATCSSKQKAIDLIELIVFLSKN